MVAKRPSASSAHPAADVLIVGSINMDLVIRTPRLPRPGQTVAAPALETIPGGKGANQAVAAARLGARVAMLGCVGSDAYGAALCEGLRREGVDTSMVSAHADAATGIACVTVANSGQNTIVIVAGANELLTPAMIEAQRAAFERARVIVCQLESPPDAVECALKLGRQLGKTVILNPAPAVGPLPTPWLAACDYLIPNETEAALLTARPVDSPDAALEAAADLHAQGARHVIITLGAHGVAYADADTRLLMPARIAQAVDTTAAGDTFVGALASSLAEGARPEAAIEFGQAAAALSVTRLGAQPSIPFRSEIAAPVPHGL
ncbi:ribokinase [Ralstonia mannitolilytica]|uniref:Ribokinase n=1 Tax=Ralstonia mannitolilytica TaxID=105219 RepID=A0AAD2AQ35_9RALS|nr:ribokinase [Ralstonia mannitolilytica]MBY4719955.1 ribokinase [Ralstonia mannitolilytica]CAJ0682198.1 Ribokinase [Ralstonia mannitolilytica]CAJ0688867.1 Ribokinase [Ralstonia mannitolilytica]CAJ0709906.1 Ribokinase [Ralstonia mannitolilytica]CAJ0774797.1 Ribokinase [Ralstonia mannitolilytica]